MTPQIHTFSSNKKITSLMNFSIFTLILFLFFRFHFEFLILEPSQALPKPTPRLSKAPTNETNSSVSVDESNSISSATSHTLNKTEESEKSDDFQQKKLFWENFDHPIMPVPIPKPRIAKSQMSKDSFETESSSLRSSKQISRDDEERLEDESFPMSDSEISEKKPLKAPQVTDLDKIDVCESSETEEDIAKFYIGESSVDVIRKSASEKRAEFAFENPGYEFSTDQEVQIPMRDFVHEKIEIYDDSLLSGEEHLMAKSTGDDIVLEEKSEFEVSEKLSRQQSEEIDVTTRIQPVMHSQVKPTSILETVKSLEEHVTVAKANAVEVLREEIKKPITLEVISKNTEEEIEKTLEEVDDSLSAVRDELIEVVKDGKLIKQSPSEFEINILPDLTYPASIPEQEELPDTPKKEPFIKIMEPVTPQKQKQSETEESQQSSNEDSFNKLDVVVKRHKPGSAKWSATDTDSESHYQSFESSSRPVSSDIENIAPYQSSEYETAQGSTTLDFHSAVSTLNSAHTISSRDSMKSLDSESSGNLASIEASEATETLVPSTMDDIESDVIVQELEFDKFPSLESETTASDEVPSSSAMKRSHEMNFASQGIETPAVLKYEEKLARSVEDLKYGSWEDTGKFGSSLEEGSMLSVSISSASNLETMVELNAEQADQLMGSLVGSYDSAKIFTSFTDEATGMSPPEFEHGYTTSMTMMTSQVHEDEQCNVNTQITSTTVDDKIESMRKRGHKRTDSTSVFPGGFVKAGSSGSDSFEDDVVMQEDSSDVISSERDETHGESSDSDYDRFETEYARSYRTPSASKGKKVDKSKEIEFSSPGHTIIETIVEDIHAETEHAVDQTGSKKLQHPVEIPNIQVTEDVATSSSTVHYAKQVEYKMSEEEYQELLDKKYKSRLADITKNFDEDIYEEDQQPSPGSDSFEMLNEPDISDEFVIVEEVAKEAHEFDSEGQSVSIQSGSKKYIRKHDEEMEKFIVKSAPEAGFTTESFEFEASPPQDEGTEEPTRGGNGYALEGRKGWVEMNLSDPANIRYPYEMDTRGILEDIKEEDTDFEVGSSRISSFKDSYSSTPDYDALVRKLNSREHDNLSMNSLQEFESLEQVISLENRRQQTRSSDESLSNGSYPKRQIAKSMQGDDISLSSLKEFEGLENACIEAHLCEIKAKEEVALLLSRSDDSSKSSGSSNGDRPSPKAKSSPPNTSSKTTVTTTTVIKGTQATQLEQRMAQEFQKLQQRAQEIMEDTSISIMEASTDSLEDKKLIYDKNSSQYVSSDSLDKDLKSVDPMTTSADSIEGSKGGKSSDVDSIEQCSPIKRRSDSIDSIEMLIASQSSKNDDLMNFEMSGGATKKFVTKTSTVNPSGQQNITTTITSTVTRSEMPQQRDISSDSLNARTEPELLLTSTESLSSSTATTNATYRNEMDMSGSTTSWGSNTMIELESATSPFPTDFYSPTSSSSHQQFQQTTTTTTTSYSSDLLSDDEIAQFASSSSFTKKSKQ